MTALCSGGTSAPKAGVSSSIIYGTGAIAALMQRKGWGWAVIIAPLLGVVAEDAASFCATDPPAQPTITEDDVKAILQLTDWDAFNLAIGKLKDLVLNLLWYELCECTSVATPSTPAAPPQLVFPNLGYSGGVCLPMRAGETKVLNLWNGTTNNAPPANWQLESFNDSAWAVGTQANTQFAVQPNLGGNILPTGALAMDYAECKPEAVAPWLAPTSGKEQFLIRWRVYVPGNADRATMGANLDSGAGTSSGWSTGIVYINGVGGGAVMNTFSWQTALGGLRPGQLNTVALWINSGNTTPLTTWDTYGWVSATLSQRGLTSPGNTLCCADPALLALLPNILQMVTLVQRQSAPFAYVYGANHVGLTGDGELAVSGLIGVSIDVTTLPSSYGRSAGTPEHLFDVGFVTLGTSDGWSTTKRIDADGSLVLPGSAAGAFTRVGYTLRPGVEVSIRELVREP